MAVPTDIPKARGSNFIDFLKILAGEASGLLLLIERTGNQENFPGYAVLILYLERKVMTLCRQILCLLYFYTQQVLLKEG